MLPKKHRINKELFKKILKEGKNFSSEHLSCKIAQLSTDCPVFTFVVSPKISKKATTRNKLKRRGRNIIKKILPEINKKKIGVIIFFKKGAEKISFQELEQEILKIL